MTTTTKLKTIRSASSVYGLKAHLDEGPGVFSAWVSVFGNLDFQGDRVVPGAFARSLAEWRAAGDPIPVIFSHRWDDLRSHIGEVSEAREDLPGAAELPEELKELGGLWVKFRLDVDEPDVASMARRMATLLERRRIKEFSFAYDVFEEERLDDGSNALIELGVIEVGPTLKGANPLTRLASRKALEDLGVDGDQAEDLATELEELEALVAEEDVTELEELEELAEETEEEPEPAEEELEEEPEPAEKGAKGVLAEVTFTGSLEERQEAIFRAAVDHAREEDLGAGGFYALYLDATFDERALVLVEGWDDPVRQGAYFELDYSLDDAGEATLGEWRAVSVEASVREKASSAKRSASYAGGPATLAGERKTKGVKDEEPAPAKDEEPSGAKDEEPVKAKDEELPEGERSTSLEDIGLTLDLLELE